MFGHKADRKVAVEFLRLVLTPSSDGKKSQITVEDLASSGTAAARQLSKVFVLEPVFNDVGEMIALVSQELLRRQEEENSLENFESILSIVCKTAVQGSILQLKLCLTIISSICQVVKDLGGSRKSKSLDYSTIPQPDHCRSELILVLGKERGEISECRAYSKDSCSLNDHTMNYTR